MTGMDRSVLKRQLYHMMFVEADESPFETIAYNDSEYLDDYESYNGCFAKFINSDIAQVSGLSFREFIDLPNHLADWIIEYGNKRTINNSNDNEAALGDLEAEMAKAKKEAERANATKGNANFRSSY